MFKRKVSIGRCEILIARSLGIVTYSLREWLNIDKVIRAQTMILNCRKVGVKRVL